MSDDKPITNSDLGRIRDEVYARAEQNMLECRGVRKPCKHCRGLGTQLYGNTSTWRRGVGGATMTVGVCDRCWGSGDADRPWLNLRKYEHEQQQMAEAEVVRYLARRFGWVVKRMRHRLRDLADFADKQARRRKLPEGEELFWWNSDWTALATQLRLVASFGDRKFEDEERQRQAAREQRKRKQ